MAKIKNYHIRSDDREYLQRLADELEFIGRAYRLDLKNGILTQFALPPRKQKRKKDDKPQRNKRAESASRNNRE